MKRCWKVVTALFFFGVPLAGCSAPEDPQKQQQRMEPAHKVQQENYRETGDLEAIGQRGALRILLLNEGSDDSYLPRVGSTVDFELNYASAFARSIGLQPVIVFVDRFDGFIPALTEGRGDLIAANLAVTESLKEQIDFTVPLEHVRQMVVTRTREQSLQNPEQLEGRTLAVRPATAFWETARTLQDSYPGLKLEALGEDLSEEEKLDMVADRRIDLTIHDSHAFTMAQAYRDDLRAAFPVTQAQPIAWGIRKDSAALKKALNRYLNQEQLRRVVRTRHTDDLPGIKERRTLRVVTRNNAASYFLWRGELLGFEYELAREFARQQKLRLEVIVAPNHDELLPMLIAGKADIAAAFLTPTQQRRAMGIAFSRPYSYASEVVVTRAGEDGLESVERLAGRSFHVRESSSYWQTLAPLRDQGLDIRLIPAPADEETEAIIAKVGDGIYDLTLADSNILDIELTWRDDIKAAFPLGEPIAHGWAVRANNQELLAAIDAFHKKEYRGLFYNVTYWKYFASGRESRPQEEELEESNVARDGVFSPYDEIIQKYADKYGFDWRLLVAQMYQESRFNPRAKSWAGAQGLMQVLPRTAKQMGISGDLAEPVTGINAGTKYLAWVRERFDQELPVQDRMWFSLAGYNAGTGHVYDARRLARQQSLDPNRWFNNVEKAMLLLSKREYASKARHGFVRGSEPVKYVREIKQRYEAYAQLQVAEGFPAARRAGISP